MTITVAAVRRLGLCSALCVALLGSWTPETAQAQEGLSYDAVVVQNRTRTGTHEFTLFTGVLALDAFTKGVTLGGAYTLHFTDLLAWEVLQGHSSFPFDTDLKGRLEAFEVRPTPFEVLEGFVGSGFVLKPLYWKGALLNESILYGEILFTAGPAWGWYTQGGRPGGWLGTAVRLYGWDWFSVRLDARYLMFAEDEFVDNPSLRTDLWLSLGTSLSF